MDQKRYRLMACSTAMPMDIMYADTYPVGEEIYMPYERRFETKTRCVYCQQKQDSSNNACEFCGAPLP